MRLVRAYNKRVHIRKTETKKEIVGPSQGSNTEPLCNLSPWWSYSHRNRGGVALRYLEGVLTWREGGVGSKGSGRTTERPLKISTCGGVVWTRWSTPLPREDLHSQKSAAPTLDCVPTPWHQSSWTCRLVEDLGISSLLIPKPELTPRSISTPRSQPMSSYPLYSSLVLHHSQAPISVATKCLAQPWFPSIFRPWLRC